MQNEFFKHEQALVSPEAQVGQGTRVWAFANIQPGAKLGQACNICDGCFIEEGAVLGDHVTVKNGVHLWQGVTLEDDVFCGAGVTFINDRFPRSHRDDGWVLEQTQVCKGATLGSNSTILCGLTIGAYASIGAGSVVTRDVPAHAIVFGNPARFRGYACRCGKKLDADHRCACGCEYDLQEQGLTERT